MGDVTTNLQILLDALKKKEKDLNELLELTKEQEKLLKEEEFNFQGFENIMRNKQFRIDDIIKIDQGFQPTYERIRSRLQQNPQLYQEAVRELQEHIRIVGELGIEVQVLETKNQTAFMNLSSRMKQDVKGFRTSKKAVTNYYSTFNKQQEAGRNQFFDSKK